jgi:hypothetical protein
VTRLKEDYVPTEESKSVGHHRDIQCDLGGGSLETRPDDANHQDVNQTLDTHLLGVGDDIGMSV